MNTAWLRCTVAPGMFSSEYAVMGTEWDGTGFSLFAPREYVRVSAEPGDNNVEGLMRVDVWDKKDDEVLLQLPRHAIESGNRFVTVKKSQVETRSTESVGTP